MKLSDYIQNMSISDAARFFGVSRPTVYKWRNGGLPHRSLMIRVHKLTKGKVSFQEMIQESLRQVGVVDSRRLSLAKKK